MTQYQINYPNTYTNKKIYHVGDRNKLFFSTNYKGNALRKIRRCCAQNPGCLFTLVDALVPPYYTYWYIDGKEAVK